MICINHDECEKKAIFEFDRTVNWVESFPNVSKFSEKEKELIKEWFTSGFQVGFTEGLCSKR